MASRGCKHPADAFCYVCGQFIKTRAKKYSVEASAKMCEAYKAYFGMPVGDQDKPWAPHFTCEHCKKTLEGKMDNCCSEFYVIKFVKIFKIVKVFNFKMFYNFQCY
jgi:hypothetical protein